jgi:hypothetical protein
MIGIGLAACAPQQCGPSIIMEYREVGSEKEFSTRNDETVCLKHAVLV